MRAILSPVPVLALTAMLATILAIAWLQHIGWTDPFNLGIFHWVGTMRGATAGATVTTIMATVSVVGSSVGRGVILAAVLLWLFWRGRRAEALWLGGVVLSGMVLNVILKRIFDAPRPDLLPHLDMVSSSSFPSGHSAGAMILYGALAILARHKAAWPMAAALIVLTGFSRIWLGVHWPTDVLAGWCEGIGWLILFRAWLVRPAGSA